MRRVREHVNRPDGLLRAPGPDALYLTLFTLQTHFAGVLSTLPALSVARTRKVCLPFLTLMVLGEAQLFHLPLSSLQAKREPVSEDLKVKRAFTRIFFVRTIFFGCFEIFVCGGLTSTTVSER